MRPHLIIAFSASMTACSGDGEEVLGGSAETESPLLTSVRVDVSGGGRGHDFGIVPAGAQLVHEFVLRNDGGEPWVRAEVVRSCGCVTGHAIAVPIEAGAAAMVGIEVDTLFHSGSHQVHFDVEYATAAGVSKRRRYDIGWSTHEWIRVIPSTLGQVELWNGAERTLEFKLQALDGVAFRVMGVSSSSGLVSVGGGAVSAPDRVDVCHTRSVVVRGDGTPRDVSVVVEVTTDHPRQPSLRIPMVIEIVPAWRLGDEASASFGNVTSGERPERLVPVFARQAGASLQATSVRLVPKKRDEPLEFLVAELVPGEEGKMANVRLRIVADPPGRHFFCDLEVETNDPVTPRARLPVFGFFKVKE